MCTSENLDDGSLTGKLNPVPFSAEDEEALKTEPCEKSADVLIELEKWRQDSLRSAMRA